MSFLNQVFFLVLENICKLFWLIHDLCSISSLFFKFLSIKVKKICSSFEILSFLMTNNNNDVYISKIDKEIISRRRRFSTVGWPSANFERRSDAARLQMLALIKFDISSLLHRAGRHFMQQFIKKTLTEQKSHKKSYNYLVLTFGEKDLLLSEWVKLFFFQPMMCSFALELSPPPPQYELCDYQFSHWH